MSAFTATPTTPTQPDHSRTGELAKFTITTVACFALTTNGVLTFDKPNAPQFSTGWNSTHSTSDLSVWVPPIPSTMQQISQNNAGLLVSLHSLSGLTWEQIARMFNVSRRSVHLWLTGGKMSAANEERLRNLEAVIAALPATSPEEFRFQILQPGASGRSLFDEVRYGLSSDEHDINRAPEPGNGAQEVR